MLGVISVPDAFGASGEISVKVADHEGPAEGEILLYRWDQARGDYFYVSRSRQALYDGEAARSIDPGKYRVKVVYEGSRPHQERVIDDVKVASGETEELELYFEKASISLKVTDHDGLGKSDVDLFKWDDRKRAYVYLTRVRRGKGLKNVPLVVEPGLYQIRVLYTETRPLQQEEITNVKLEDKDSKSFSFHFNKGALEFTATDQDGWAKGELNFYRWDNAKRKYELVPNSRQRFDSGKASVELSPGLYQIRVTYTEALPYQVRTIPNVRVEDGKTLNFNFYFDRGQISIVLADSDGWGEGFVTFYRWEQSEKGYSHLPNARMRISNGRAVRRLSPGIYRVRVNYSESSPSQTAEVEGVVIEDRLSKELIFRFGDKVNPPPNIQVFGPREIGDGDGEIEFGESIEISFLLADDDFVSADLYWNGRKIRRYEEPGYYEQVLKLDEPGKQEIEITARDFADPPNQNSWVFDFAVLEPDEDDAGESSESDKEDRVCSVCQTHYHDGENFCPRDGTRLKVLTGGARVRTKFDPYRPDSVIAGIVELELKRAGIEPDSAAARRVREATREELNPFDNSKRLAEEARRIIRKRK